MHYKQLKYLKFLKPIIKTVVNLLKYYLVELGVKFFLTGLNQGDRRTRMKSILNKWK